MLINNWGHHPTCKWDMSIKYFIIITYCFSPVFHGKLQRKVAHDGPYALPKKLKLLVESESSNDELYPKWVTIWLSLNFSLVVKFLDLGQVIQAICKPYILKFYFHRLGRKLCKTVTESTAKEVPVYALKHNDVMDTDSDSAISTNNGIVSNTRNSLNFDLHVSFVNYGSLCVLHCKRFHEFNNSIVY